MVGGYGRAEREWEGWRSVELYTVRGVGHESELVELSPFYKVEEF